MSEVLNKKIHFLLFWAPIFMQMTASFLCNHDIRFNQVVFINEFRYFEQLHQTFQRPAIGQGGQQCHKNLDRVFSLCPPVIKP